jgi:hypothetical protein
MTLNEIQQELSERLGDTFGYREAAPVVEQLIAEALRAAARAVAREALEYGADDDYAAKIMDEAYDLIVSQIPAGA